MPPPRNPRTRRGGPGQALPPTADGGVAQTWLSARAAAYSWPCPRCACTRNLRGLLREICSNCTHVHQPPAKETP